MGTEQWMVDEALDAHGFATIRRDNGTVNGDIEAQPIATVYDVSHAKLIALAPQFREAAKDAIEAIKNACRRRNPNANNGLGLAYPEEQVALEELQAIFDVLKGA